MSRHARRAAKRRRHAVLTGAATAAALGGTAGVAHGAVIQVTTTASSGAGSLAAAIDQANGTPAVADTITFSAAVTPKIDLTSTLPTISTPLTIQGPGAGVLTIDGQPTDSVLRVSKSGPLISVSVSGLTVTGGDTGVSSYGANLSLSALTVRDNGNAENPGGGVYAMDRTYDGSQYVTTGSVLLDGVTLSGNVGANAGGVFAFASSITIRKSTISGNSTPRAGYYAGVGAGGAALFGPTVLVEQSTLAQNVGAASGGGLAIGGAQATAPSLKLSDSTVTGNRADADGGGVLVTSKYATPPSLTVESATVARNRAGGHGGGIASQGAAVTLSSSAVGGNRSSDPDADLAGTAAGATFTAQRSLVTSPGAFSLGTGALTGVDPGLQPLGSNGGPTPTSPPAAGSPLLDAGQAPAGVTTDQRGLGRTVDLGGFPNAADGTDIGAVELAAAPSAAAEAPLPATATVADNPTAPATPAPVTVTGPTPPPNPPPVRPFATGLAYAGKGGKGTVQVVVPGAGKVALAGGGIVAVTKAFTAEGVQAVPVKLGKAALKKLKKAKKKKLKATVQVVFTPAAGGAPTTKTVALTFVR